MSDLNVFVPCWWWAGCFQSLLLILGHWSFERNPSCQQESPWIAFPSLPSKQCSAWRVSLYPTSLWWHCTCKHRSLVSSNLILSPSKNSFINDQPDCVSLCWSEDAAQPTVENRSELCINRIKKSQLSCHHISYFNLFIFIFFSEPGYPESWKTWIYEEGILKVWFLSWKLIKSQTFL